MSGRNGYVPVWRHLQSVRYQWLVGMTMYLYKGTFNLSVSVAGRNGYVPVWMRLQSVRYQWLGWGSCQCPWRCQCWGPGGRQSGSQSPPPSRRCQMWSMQHSIRPSQSRNPHMEVCWWTHSTSHAISNNNDSAKNHIMTWPHTHWLLSSCTASKLHSIWSFLVISTHETGRVFVAVVFLFLFVLLLNQNRRRACLMEQPDKSSKWNICTLPAFSWNKHGCLHLKKNWSK